MVEPKMCYRITPCKPCLYNNSCSGSLEKTFTINEPVVDEGPTLDQMLAKLPGEEGFNQWMDKNYPRFWAWGMVPPKEFEEKFITPYKQEMGSGDS